MSPTRPQVPAKSSSKNTAVAINPFDCVLQLVGRILASNRKYPCILGTDVASYIVEIGADVKRFKIGDRVFGSAAGIDKNVNNASECGFQLYTVMREYIISPTPSHITDEQACVLGLGVGTAAYGLFHSIYLRLDMLSLSFKSQGQGKRVISVTGGSSSVGSNAVQLAVSAGYRVISTSSPKNFEYVKKLGASQVFDYNSKMIVGDMLDALNGFELVGAYAIGKGAVEVCTEVMMGHDAKSTRKRIALAGAIIPAEQLVYSALEARQFVPAPPPQVVGHGLEKIHEALEMQRLGVPGRNLVVTL